MKPIYNSKQVNDILKPIIKDEQVEHLIALLVDREQKLKSIHFLTEGDLTSVTVSVSSIVSLAAFNKAKGLILVHNHPDAASSPTETDRELTTKIEKALTIVNIRLLDHVIIGKDGPFSFADERKTTDDWYAQTDFDTMERMFGLRHEDFSDEDGYQEFVDACDKRWKTLTQEIKNQLYNKLQS